jgi:hypothetical protein
LGFRGHIVRGNIIRGIDVEPLEEEEKNIPTPQHGIFAKSIGDIIVQMFSEIITSTSGVWRTSRTALT